MRFGGCLAQLLVTACGIHALPPPSAVAPTDRIPIIASERGPSGARLVALDEHGDRQFVLVQAAPALARDANPVVSPDGMWIVFASSRDRSLDETSLWIAPLAAEAPPVRLTSGPSIESHPAWTPDGRSVVFASTRDGGNFDLWQLRVDRGRAVGEPTQLTHGRGHEITPAIADDGAIIYTEVTPLGGADVESHLEQLTSDGTIVPVTEGPADSSPALSPDGTTIAFARPAIHNNVRDSELWQMRRGDRVATRMIDVPVTDESGPVWSRDGRFVFATSVLRGTGGKPVFSSIVFVDLQEHTRRLRILQDRAGAIVRLTPAVTRTALDASVLDSNPEYLSELARTVVRLLQEPKAN